MLDIFKGLTILFGGLLVAITVNAAIGRKDTAPFIPEVYKAIRELEDADTAYGTRITALEQIPVARTMRAEYDVALHGGTIGAHSLGVALPAGAIIKRSFYQIGTQFVDAGAGTVALSCEDADNIVAAADITGKTVGSLTIGASDGAIANMKTGIAANCEITATVAGAAQTAGKLVVFVEYEQGF